MKKSTYISCFLFLMLFSCQPKWENSRPEKFLLSGITNNMPDRTMIYFTDILTNQIIDSAFVIKNAFQFESNFPVYPTQIYLHNKDYSEAKSVWVENKPMIFDASEFSFSDAKISGSQTQIDLELLLDQINTVETDEEEQKIAIAFVRKYPESRVSASILAGYAPTWGKEITHELFEGLSNDNKESVYGLQVAKFIDLNRHHEIGDKFTDFEMKNNKGELVKFSNKLGRVTLLEFWASWCGPCRKQNPELVKTYQKYKDSGFVIFSVSLDFSEDDWEKAIEKDNLTWSHVSDLKGRNSAAAIIYGVNAIPDNFLIDQNGKIIAKYVWGEALSQAIEGNLENK